MKIYQRLSVGCLVSLLAATTSLGQQRQQSPPGQQGRDQQQRDQRDQARYRLSPEGWIRVAVDYDNDGRFDAIETIYAFDLEQARKRSGARAAQKQRDRRQGVAGADESWSQEFTTRRDSQSDRQYQESRRSRESQRRRPETITGEILQLRKETLAGKEEPCVIARIRTDENRSAKVVLGKQSDLESLDLREGGQITVKGFKGRLNDKSMLLASTISADGSDVKVGLGPSRGAKRVRGEILSTRTTKFKGHEQPFVVGQVKLQSGKTASVNLGPQSKLKELGLKQGDKVRMLVRPARLNGKASMVADQIYAKGKRINLTPRREMVSARSKGNSKNRDPQSDRSKPKSEDESRQTDGQGALGLAVSDSEEGPTLVAIHPQGPAADKDFQEGDLILKVNGESVETAKQVVELIRGMQPGEQVTLRIRRDQETKTVKVALTSRKKLTPN